MNKKGYNISYVRRIDFVSKEDKHVCPVWAGYLLANPLRALMHNPKKILSPYIKKDMTVMDIGCAMGFFSLPLAQMVGEKGKVICIDLQKEMLDKLEKRAKQKKLLEKLEIIACTEDSLCIDKYQASLDFVLAFAVAHETQDVNKFLLQIYNSLKKDAKLLLVEPKSHVPKKVIEDILKTAQDIGFKLNSRGNYPFARGLTLQK